MKGEKTIMGDFEDVFKGFDDPIGDGTISSMPGKNTGKRILVLFIVDATRSMEGQAIGQVNYALAEIFSDLKNFASDNLLNMDLAIMSFSNSIKWEMKPEDINTCYAVPQINVRPGNTQYGVVYHELSKMLRKDSLLRSSGKQAAPVLVLLTDGAPVDDYSYDLEQLKKNGYFMLANRSAVIMGEGANDPKARLAVSEFTMDDKMVLTTDNTSEIVNAIKLATLHTIKDTDINPRPVVPHTTSNPPVIPPFGNEPEGEGESVNPFDPVPEGKDHLSPAPDVNPFGITEDSDQTDDLQSKGSENSTGSMPLENPFGDMNIAATNTTQSSIGDNPDTDTKQKDTITNETDPFGDNPFGTVGDPIFDDPTGEGGTTFPGNPFADFDNK